MKVHDLALKAGAFPIPSADADMIQWLGTCPEDGCGGSLILSQDKDDFVSVTCSRTGNGTEVLMPLLGVENIETDLQVLPFDLERKTQQHQIADMARREAKSRDLQLAAAQDMSVVEWMTTRELIAKDMPPVRWLIDGLWPKQGVVGLFGQAKAGKSTFIMNVVRSLVTGKKFLGQFDVTVPKGNIAVIDLELSEMKLQEWYREGGINTDKVYVVSLRGRAGTIGRQMLDLEARAALARQFRERNIEVLIIDPLSVLLNGMGIDENSNSEVGNMLRMGIMALVTEAGISDCLIAHHTGHGGKRERGASVIGDMPDALWYLTVKEATASDSDDEGEPTSDNDRFLRAKGRDVEVPESLLGFNGDSRVLSIDKIGASRSKLKFLARLTSNENRIMEILRDEGAVRSSRVIRDKSGLNGSLFNTALNNLVSVGTVEKFTESGDRAMWYRLADGVAEELDATADSIQDIGGSLPLVTPSGGINLGE
jgi:hypothetical protein